MTAPSASLFLPVARFWGTRRELPLIYAIVIIALIEAITTHLVVVRFAPRIAWALSAFSVSFLIFVGWIGATLRARPVTLDRDLLHVRVGLSTNISVPLRSVRMAPGLPTVTSSPTTVGTTTLLGSNCCVAVEPSFDARIGGRRRAIERIFLSLDDVAAFAAELDRRKASLPAA
ncbi:hypothetical protein [Sphingomonas zeae]